MRVLAALVLLASGSAAADRTLPIKGQRFVLGDITIEASNGLFAQRGAVRAPLSGEPFRGRGLVVHELQRATVSDDGQSITVDYADFCTTFTMHFTRRQVEARLANVAGLALHRKHQWAAATQRFAEAMQLDPDFELAALNLASARAQLHTIKEAVAALAPRLAAHPVATYLRIVDDPELAPLLDAPEVRAIRTAQPGTATTANTPHIALSPERKLVASRMQEACGMSGMHAESLVLTALDGTEVGALPLGGCDAPSKAAAAHADRILADLGFQPVADLDFQTTDDLRKVRLAKAKLGVVTDRTMLRIVRGNTVLVEQPEEGDFLEWAAFVPAANAVVVHWTRDIPEAECGNPPPYAGVTVLALP